MPDLETTTCAVCKSVVEGYGFEGDVLDRFQREELGQVRTYVAGHECSACGDVICVTCKKEQVGAHDLVGSCPRCGNPWAAKRTFFRPYMERGNRDMFHKLLKYDKQLREKRVSPWPGVLQILGGVVAVSWAMVWLHRAATADPHVARPILSSGIFYLLCGTGLLINGFAQFVPPSSMFRTVCGTALIAVGLGFPVHAICSPDLAAASADAYGTIIVTIAFCTVGVRHILAHRRHRHHPLDPP